MIAADSSVLIAWLKGEAMSPGISERFQQALRTHRLILPPVVVAELSSATLLPKVQADLIRDLATLPIIDAYWERAGRLRADVSRQGFKARLGDVLVAQACIDAATPLLAQDRDFRHFETFGLTLFAS